MKVKDHFLSGEIFELAPTEIKGILRTQPVPENLSRYYDSKQYISHHQDSGSLREKIYKLLQNYNLNYKQKLLSKIVPEKGRVLDYGCGAGKFVKFIEDKYETYGYEPNRSAISHTLKKIKSAKIISDLDMIPDSTLDAVTLWHVFEHIENQTEVLSIFYRKLKPEGKLVIAVPNHTSYDGQKYKEFWAAYDVPRHIFHFSRSGMTRLMNNKFWRIKEIKPLLLDAFYIAMLSEQYKKSPIFWLKGFLFGTISNIKASKTGEFSSLIYIIEKNKKMDF